MPRISIRGARWLLDGALTYPGAPAEGLLMNVRMVNATFEDRNRDDWAPEANTDRFIAHIPDYVDHGVRAFTLCLQGGFPGYEGALNSAFEHDGALRPTYMERMLRVIRACDAAGAAVILGCFYQRQSGILDSANAIRTGLANVVSWITSNDLGNVLLEIANEFGHPGFQHVILKDPIGQAELIRLAKAAAPDLLVSTSGLGHGHYAPIVAESCDYCLIHYNETPMDEVPQRIAALRPYGKPIVCNEDTKVGEQGARVARLSVTEGASWGLMTEGTNQHYPFSFRGHLDDPPVYQALHALTHGGE